MGTVKYVDELFTISLECKNPKPNYLIVKMEGELLKTMMNQINTLLFKFFSTRTCVCGENFPLDHSVRRIAEKNTKSKRRKELMNFHQVRTSFKPRNHTVKYYEMNINHNGPPLRRVISKRKCLPWFSCLEYNKI